MKALLYGVVYLAGLGTGYHLVRFGKLLWQDHKFRQSFRMMRERGLL